MFTYEYSFSPNENNKDFLLRDGPMHIDFFSTYELIYFEFFRALCENGQAIFDCYNTVKFENYYCLRFVSPFKDSLSEKYYNKQTRDNYDKLVEWSYKLPELKYIGENSNYNDVYCAKASASFYVIYTDFFVQGSSIINGDCGRIIPLYLFPDLSQQVITDLDNWRSNDCVYKNMIIKSDLGKLYAEKMMTNPKSKLNLKGLQVRANLENELKKPVYYYLCSGFARKKQNCPICGQIWQYDMAEEKGYRCLCERCRIVIGY